MSNFRLYADKDWLKEAIKTKSLSEIAAECDGYVSNVVYYLKKFKISSNKPRGRKAVLTDVQKQLNQKQSRVSHRERKLAKGFTFINVGPINLDMKKDIEMVKGDKSFVDYFVYLHELYKENKLALDALKSKNIDLDKINHILSNKDN